MATHGIGSQNYRNGMKTMAPVAIMPLQEAIPSLGSRQRPALTNYALVTRFRGLPKVGVVTGISPVAIVGLSISTRPPLKRCRSMT